MAVEQADRGVQYTVDRNGKLVAVVVSPELWQRILDDLEDSEDRALVRDLVNRLQNPPSSWAMPWEEVAPEWR